MAPAIKCKSKSLQGCNPFLEGPGKIFANFPLKICFLVEFFYMVFAYFELRMTTKQLNKNKIGHPPQYPIVSLKKNQIKNTKSETLTTTPGRPSTFDMCLIQAECSKMEDFEKQIYWL